MDNLTRAGHFHAVRFYENPESLVRIVAEFLGEGFVLGQPALVIGTPDHNAGIVKELGERHFAIDEMVTSGSLLLLDARELMAEFMVDGMPDGDRFRAAAIAALARVGREKNGGTTRAYGEMVDLLWKDGRSVAAVRLEMLWNQLAMQHDFKLLCGYAMGNFYKDASLAEIIDQHSHVVSSDGSVKSSKVPTPTIN